MSSATPTATDLGIYQVTRDYRAHVNALEANAAGDLTEYFAQTARELNGQIDALSKQIGAAQDAYKAYQDDPEHADFAEPVNVNWLYKQRSLRNLLKSVLEHVSAFADFADSRVQQAQADAIQAARTAAQGQLDKLLPPDVSRAVPTATGDVTLSDRLTTGLRNTPLDVTLTQAGRLSGGPVSELFDGFGQQASADVKQAIVSGVVAGKNPKKIAGAVQDALGVSQSRALTISRTETLNAYRQASLESYRQNSDVVDSYTWICDLSTNTCGDCLALNGQVFSLDETPDSHANCRCGIFPNTGGYGNTNDGGELLDDNGDPILDDDGNPISENIPPIETGEDWYAKQTPEDQAKIVGPGKQALIAAGELTLPELVGERVDPTWGRVRYEKSLAELGFTHADVVEAQRQIALGQTAAAHPLARDLLELGGVHFDAKALQGLRRLIDAMPTEMDALRKLLPRAGSLQQSEATLAAAVQAAQSEWDRLRFDLAAKGGPDLPAHPLYYSNSGAPGAIPTIVNRGFYEYLDIHAALNRLQDAQALHDAAMTGSSVTEGYAKALQGTLADFVAAHPELANAPDVVALRQALVETSGQVRNLARGAVKAAAAPLEFGSAEALKVETAQVDKLFEGIPIGDPVTLEQSDPASVAYAMDVFNAKLDGLAAKLSTNGAFLRLARDQFYFTQEQVDAWQVVEPEWTREQARQRALQSSVYDVMEAFHTGDVNSGRFTETPLQVAINEAAVTEFKLRSAKGYYTAEDIAAAKDQYGSYKNGLRAYLRAMYDDTQAYFRENGITEITVYRGMRRNAEQVADGTAMDAAQKADVKSLPLSSWSTDPQIAIDYATGSGSAEVMSPREYGMVLATRIPVSEILSTGMTGFGATPLREALVLGGKYETAAVHFKTADGITPDKLYSILGEYHAGSTATADTTTSGRGRGPAGSQLVGAEGLATSPEARAADLLATPKSKLADLRAVAGDLGLDATGTRAKVVARISERLNPTAASVVEAKPPEALKPVEPAAPAPVTRAELERYTLSQLKTLAQSVQATAKVSLPDVHLDADTFTHAALDPIIGHAASPAEIGALAGARSGDTVDVHADPATLHGRSDVLGEQQLTPIADLGLRGDGYTAERMISRDAAGRLVMTNIDIRIPDKAQQGQGIGTEIFAGEVRTLASLGFDRIEAWATGDVGYNGAYTWARLGYDGPIPEGILPAEWSKYTRVSQLMATPEGQAWWKENGMTFPGRFDLTPGSYSMRTLAKYLAEKGVDIPLTAPDTKPQAWGRKAALIDYITGTEAPTPKVRNLATKAAPGDFARQRAEAAATLANARAAVTRAQAQVDDLKAMQDTAWKDLVKHWGNASGALILTPDVRANPAYQAERNQYDILNDTTNAARRDLFSAQAAVTNVSYQLSAVTVKQAADAITVNRETLAKVSTPKEAVTWLNDAIPQAQWKLGGNPHMDAVRPAVEQLATLAEQYPEAMGTLKLFGLTTDASFPKALKDAVGGTKPSALWGGATFPMDIVPGMAESGDGAGILFPGSAWRDPAGWRATARDAVAMGEWQPGAIDGGSAYVVTHEFGHVVEYYAEHSPDAGIRQQYSDLMTYLNAQRVNAFDDYAKSNAHEMFAESFAALYYGPERLRQLPYVQRVNAFLEALFNQEPTP